MNLLEIGNDPSLQAQLQRPTTYKMFASFLHKSKPAWIDGWQQMFYCSYSTIEHRGSTSSPRSWSSPIVLWASTKDTRYYSNQILSQHMQDWELESQCHPEISAREREVCPISWYSERSKRLIVSLHIQMEAQRINSKYVTCPCDCHGLFFIQGMALLSWGIHSNMHAMGLLSPSFWV